MLILSTSEQQFLSLLKAGLWNTTVDSSDLFQSIDWKSVFKMAQKQTVLALVYDGIAQLEPQYRPSKPVLMKWFSHTMQTEKINDSLNKSLVHVVNKYKAEGLRPVLLKGQGLGQYYQRPLHRTSGDIDLYFFDDYEKANAVAATWENVHFEPETTYHRALFYNDVEIENHLVYVDFYSQKNKRAWSEVQQLLPLCNGECFHVGDFKVEVPSPQMNVIYVFLHLMHHFLQIGVGMRQVCDWTCLWYAKHNEIDRELFLKCVDLLGIRRAMTALAYVVTNYLGLPADYIPLEATTTQAKEDGEMMLRDILDMGNFGKDTEIGRGFIRNHHWHNLRSYGKAFSRQMRLYRFYPSEVRAYPWVWLKSKF